MKFYLCIALILAIVAFGIGFEMKRMNKGSSMRSSPKGFITIEMDHDSESSSGWGNGGWGSGWSDGWSKPMPRMQISIRKKFTLPNLGMMLSHGWDDSSEESEGDGWSGGGGGSSYGGSSGSYGGGSSSYGGSSSGWSSNGYDGNSGYRRRSRS